jgi:DNA-binding transcriptional MocR family regulator
VDVDLAGYLRGSGSSTGIALTIERLLESSALAPGDRLPAIRDLAAALSVNPATVAAAYRTLRHRGLAHSEGRRGTRLNDPPSIAAVIGLAIPDGVRNLADGSPDPRLLPDLRRALASIGAAPVAYGGPASLQTLLEIARAQLEADGIAGDCLTVVSGALDGIERVLSAHLRPGDRLLLEDPCFSRTLGLARSLALVPVSVRIDDRGPLPDALAAALRSGPAAFVVTPRAQNPTGAALDPGRADELRAVLRGHPGLVLVEDDHASLVAGAAAVSLVDGWQGPWAVVRSFAKALGPDLRLAVMAGDATTVDRVERRHALGPGWVSHILQAAAAWLLADPATADLLRTARATYAQRRTALLDVLAERDIEAHGVSGFNVWVPVAHESRTVQDLLEAGWAVSPGEYCRISSPPGVRITAATLRPEEAPLVADVLADGAPRSPSRTAFA